MNKFLIVFVGLLLFTSFSFAISPQDILWNGSVTISLSKTSFSDSENISGKITLSNIENYPLVGGKLVIHIAQGKYDYPSQVSDSDNIIHEQIIDTNWVLPRAQKEISFSLPPQKSGDYRFDVYSWVSKSKLTGASNILNGPSSITFSVTGPSQTSKLKIMRALTSFNKVVGPVGFPINPNTAYSGVVIIRNSSSTDLSGAKLGVTVCEWASPFCNSNELFFDVPLVQSNKTVSVPVNLTSPQTPSAYEIQLKVYNGNTIESIYKSRVISSGATAKSRKIFIKGLDTKNYSVGVYTMGSPDHFNNPTFKDFLITAKLFNNSEEIESKSINISALETGGLIFNEFSFESKVFTKVCVENKKESVVYELECFDAPIKEIQAAYDARNPKLVEVNYTYDNKTSTLSFTLKKDSINARVSVYESANTIFTQDVNTTTTYSNSISVPRSPLILAVDDFDAKKQIMLNINTTPTGQNLINDYSSLPDCSANSCKSGDACLGESYNSKQGVCCTSICIPAIISPASDGIFSLPLIFWIGLALLILAAVSLYSAITTMRGKK